MVLVLVGNASVTQSLQAFGATMTQTAVRSQQRVDRLSAVVTQLPTTAGPPFDLSAELVLARQGASILTQQTRDSNTSILEYNAFREGFVYLIAFVPFVLLLFSLIAMYKYWRFYTLMYALHGRYYEYSLEVLTNMHVGRWWDCRRGSCSYGSPGPCTWPALKLPMTCATRPDR